MDSAGNNQSGIEQRLAALEQQLAQQKEELDGQGRKLAQLGLWQQGRLFGYIARLFPKTRSVLFFHADFFADNTKYAFLAFRRIAEKHGVACNFLINDDNQRAEMKKHGLPVLPPMREWTVEHLRLLMSTRVLVACNHFTPFVWNPPIPYFLLQGSRLIQLWHGIPYKEIGFLYSDTPAGAFNSLRISTTGPADVFVAPGSGMQEQWRQWFAFREFSAAGYPRNDALFNEVTGDELINVDLNMLRDLKAARAAGRKTILYTPTFRDNIGITWLDKIDLPGFANWCREKGYELFVKLHPVEYGTYDELRQKLPQLRFANPYTDVHPLLRQVDLLVTDYSSLALDYLLLDRPIIFYWPDIEDYRAQCRNLLPDFESRVAGEKATDAGALKQAIENVFGGADPWTNRRRELARRMFDYQDGGSADRVARLILEQLDMPEQLPAGWGV